MQATQAREITEIEMLEIRLGRLNREMLRLESEATTNEDDTGKLASINRVLGEVRRQFCNARDAYDAALTD